MSWSLLRVVHFARHPRRHHTTTAAATVVDAAHARRRHPAMAGLNVSPVHGRHCICQRCQRDADTAA